MNRVVVITGASSGLGLSLAEKFVAHADTVYGASKTRGHWREARKRIPSRDRFLLYRADVSSEPAVKRFLSLVSKREGRIDILINNAGYANRPLRTEAESLREFQKNLSQNLISTFLVSRSAIPIFQKQKKGWIVNIASMAGKRAVPFLSAYSASKFGVVALTQSIAKENPQAGFQCIAVCPGGINTPMRAKVFGAEDAGRQQSADFVADKILEILEGKIPVASGGDVVIRHGRLSAVNPPPEA